MTVQRTGWDLVTSRPLTAEQRRRLAEIAAIETGEKTGKRKIRKSKPVRDYPAAVCMMCGNECDRSEEAIVEGGKIEMWCYCEACDVQTFHPVSDYTPDWRDRAKASF